MGGPILADSVGSVLETVFHEGDGQLQVVNPSLETIPELVTRLSDHDDPPDVRLFADERPLKRVMDDFIVASTAADLVAEDVLSIRLPQSVPRNSLVVSAGAIVSLVDGGDSVAGLRTTDDSFVADTREHYRHVWESADEFTLRTPPISRVEETLSEEIGETTAADFDALLETLDTVRGDGDGLDEVTVSLLVAAKHQELLYDISKWGEDVGLASKATFSRTKTELEDNGLIDTEKVPIDVGRPRLRLLFADGRLDGASPDELVDVVTAVLD
jgi:hypothetical protein